MVKSYIVTPPPLDEDDDGIIDLPDDEPVYELKPGLKRCQHRMRYTGHQCQLAELHVGRHAWEPSWVERVAEIEGEAQ